MGFIVPLTFCRAVGQKAIPCSTSYSIEPGGGCRLRSFRNACVNGLLDELGEVVDICCCCCCCHSWKVGMLGVVAVLVGVVDWTLASTCECKDAQALELELLLTGCGTLDLSLDAGWKTRQHELAEPL